MQRRFVLLAKPRSGSTMLVSLLGAHPEIHCFGELMRRTPQLMLRDGYRGVLRNLESVDPKYRDDTVRFENPHAFVDEVMAKRATTPIVGFKLLLAQHPDFMDELIANPDYTKILLYRANALAAFSSGRIAKATGQGWASKKTEIKRAKVTFEEYDFRVYLERRDLQYKGVRQRLAASGEPYLDVEYLDLVSGLALPHVLELLGANPAVTLQTRTRKRNPSNLLERFSNPDRVQTVLKSMGAEHWAVERPLSATPTSASR